jgi:hypothetical protein
VGEHLLTFSVLFFGELVSAPSFLTQHPSQGWGWLPVLWPKVKTGSSKGGGSIMTKKKKK